MLRSKNWVIGVLALAMGIGMVGAVHRSRAAALQDKATEKETDQAAAQLEAIGGLSAVNAQHTFLLIGVLSDAFVKQVYDAKHVRSIANGVVQQLTTVSDMLEKVQDGELSDEDDEYVDKIVEIYGLLQDQAKALSKCAENPGEAEGQAFEKARKASLTAIEKLLGTEEKKRD